MAFHFFRFVGRLKNLWNNVLKELYSMEYPKDDNLMHAVPLKYFNEIKPVVFKLAESYLIDLIDNS